MLNGCAYILTVDVGNTFIRFGLFAEDSAAAQECPLATCEITTPSSITADEARMRLAQVMAALAADAGMPGALVRCAENSEAFVNTVRLTVPPDAELSKIAVHYLHNAAFAADKTTLRTGADGVSILFAVDMTQPYLD